MNRTRYQVAILALVNSLWLVCAPLPGQDAVKATSISTVYVSRILEGMVVGVDVTTDQIVCILHTGTNPAEVAVVDSLSRAFVADLTDGTVTVIDTISQSVTDTIDVGHPVAAAGADQTTEMVYVLDFSNGTPGTNIHEIDADTGIEVADVAVGSRLQNIALDPDESTAYLTDFVDGVLVLDTSSLTVTTTVPLADLPHGVAVHPGLDRLYVTQIDSDSVKVLNTANLAVVGTLSVGDAPQWIGVDTIRNKAFVTNEGDGTVSVIDLGTNTVASDTISVGAEPLTGTVHEASAKAYVYNAGDGTISIINTITETVVATLDPVFGDGFESGDTTAWSAAVP